MEEVQSRISSGYRVETAADNAAYWSIATTMRSDNAALSTVQDALGLGAAKVDTSYAGMSSAIDVVSEIKAKLVAAREPGVDKTKINKELQRTQEPAGIGRQIGLLLGRELALQRQHHPGRHQVDRCILQPVDERHRVGLDPGLRYGCLDPDRHGRRLAWPADQGVAVDQPMRRHHDGQRDLLT